MGKLIKKRLIEGSNIDDSKFEFVMVEHFSKKHFTTKYLHYQPKVDEYFFEYGKEVKHFFIFDDEKDYELTSLINKTDDENRKLELELLRCGLAYNKEDIFTFGKIYTDKLLYENIEYSLRKNVIELFDEIIFEEKDGIEGISYVLYKKGGENEKIFKKTSKSKSEEFKIFIENLKKGEIVKYYTIDEDNYILKLKEESKKNILKDINKDESLKQKFQGLFTYKITSINIDEGINNYVYGKNDLDESISYEDLKYYIIGNIKDNHIQQNKIYLESSEEELIGVLSKSKYETLFKKYKNIGDYLLYIKDGERDTKICRFTYKIDGRIENITNYKFFKEIVINNQSISIELKNELIEIFKKSLPIVGVTVSGRQSQTSGTITPFFELYQKIYNEGMGNIIRNNGLHNLITLDYDFVGINIDFSNLKLKIKETFNEKTILTYKKRIKERIGYCSTIYGYLVE